MIIILENWLTEKNPQINLSFNMHITQHMFYPTNHMFFKTQASSKVF